MYINIIYKLLHGEANDELSGPLESTRKDAEWMDEIVINYYLRKYYFTYYFIKYFNWRVKSKNLVTTYYGTQSCIKYDSTRTVQNSGLEDVREEIFITYFRILL